MNDPADVPAISDAMTLHHAGDLRAAEAAYRRIIGADPCCGDALHLLGQIAGKTGRPAVAEQMVRRALDIHPQAAIYHNTLGNILLNAGRREESVNAFTKARSLQPNLAVIHSNLGNAYKELGEVDEADSCYRRAIQLQPTSTEALSNLATLLHDLGRPDEAMAMLERAIALRPNDPQLRSTHLYLLQFHPDHTADMLLDAAKARETRLPAIIPSDVHGPSNAKLRVGYVSPDFRDHVVGRNVLPLFRHHTRSEFEIHAFSNVTFPDDITSEFKRLSYRWHDIRFLSDDALADLVRLTGIDILVDLTLHMPGNRLSAFARKLAPVQVTFAGYPGTTGLSAIDYRLSDPYLDPPENPSTMHSEITIRLPHSFWCYTAEPQIPEVNALPAAKAGHITFGNFNNFAKLNDAVFDLWATLLNRVENSTLMLLAPRGRARDRVLQRMDRQNIPADRLLFRDVSSRKAYLRNYRHIDIALDPFPYNGHTTSLDALWMGIPVVTMVGKTIVGRAGLSQLSNLGLTELVAHTPEQYLQIATDLAHNWSRLAELRSQLRPRMESSPLMDAAGFTRAVEAAYRSMRPVASV